MRFCPWYPLAEADAHAPAGEGVLQLRLAEGLLDYPRGRSAMVHYEHAPDVRAAAARLAGRAARYAGRNAGRAILCRHLEPGDEAPADVHARVLDQFVRRFGAPPAWAP